MAGIAIPQEGTSMVRRTLGSLAPHPANIGKIIGAKTGITAPRMKLAGGGIASAENLEQNMFQPINASGVGIPNADINFISSPQLQSGPGAPQAKVAQPQQQQSPEQQFNQDAGAVGNLAGAYVAGSKIYNAGLPDWITNFFGDTGANAAGLANNIGAGYGIGTATAPAFAGAIPADVGAGAGLGTGIGTDAIFSSADLGGGAGIGTALSSVAGAGDFALPAASAALDTGGLDALASLAFFEKGGSVQKRDDGGEINSLSNSLMRREANETFHPSGFLNSAGPGRTDTISTNVPTGAYVVPADVVAGIGEGNSLAGSAVIDRMFHSQPHGIMAPKIREGRGAPQARAPESSLPAGIQSGPTVDTSFINNAGAYAKGGKTTKQSNDKAPVLLAGGEHVINPRDIVRKFGNLKKGHQILDHWVIMMRDKHIKELKKLAPPVGSRIKKK